MSFDSDLQKEVSTRGRTGQNRHRLRHRFFHRDFEATYLLAFDFEASIAFFNLQMHIRTITFEFKSIFFRMHLHVPP